MKLKRYLNEAREQLKYWQYYINNTLGDVAADKKVLEEGDKLEWRFEEVPF